MWSLAAAQRVIVIAGCLAMVYTQLTMSPATIELARSVGGNGLHIGILGALPTAMLFTQFLAALLANHLRYRRRTWFVASVVQRLVFVPLGVALWHFPDLGGAGWIWSLILLTAVNHALLHFCTPLWLSWMGDYLPRVGLNRYWGIRHRWMQWAGALSLLAGAWLIGQAGLDIHRAFAILVGAGAVFGLADILLFLRVEEPPVSRVPEPRVSEVLAAPLRDRDFRSFISFSCFWHVAAMTGAPFISYYLLEHIGMDVWRLLLLWTFAWVGGALFGARLGRLAERYGNRPVLVLCTAFKSSNMVALLLLPRDAVVAFWIMVPVFVIDSVLNAGIAIANNGFMLKNSPAENRTMFIAAGTALAGMVGGVTSVVTGAFLVLTSGWSVPWHGVAITNFHVAFAVSVVLRLAAAVLARQVREPDSRRTVHVVVHLVGATPIRVLRFPVGLYRSFLNAGAGPQTPKSAEVSAGAAIDRTPTPSEPRGVNPQTEE